MYIFTPTRELSVLLPFHFEEQCIHQSISTSLIKFLVLEIFMNIQFNNNLRDSTTYRIKIIDIEIRCQVGNVTQEFELHILHHECMISKLTCFFISCAESLVSGLVGNVELLPH